MNPKAKLETIWQADEVITNLRLKEQREEKAFAGPKGESLCQKLESSQRKMGLCWACLMKIGATEGAKQLSETLPQENIRNSAWQKHFGRTHL